MKPAVSILAAATAAAIASAALAAGPGHAASRPADRHLRIDLRPTAFGQGDVGAKGESPADTLAFTDPVREHGKRIGTAYITGIDANGKGQNAVNGTLALPHGSVVIAGAGGQHQRFTVAIVGGTGRFIGTRGVATVTDRDNAAGSIDLRFAR